MSLEAFRRERWDILPQTTGERSSICAVQEEILFPTFYLLDTEKCVEQGEYLKKETTRHLLISKMAIVSLSL
jgi:hypothetical protein